MRLDRFIAHRAAMSRKHAGAAVRAGRVTVDGAVETDRGRRLHVGQEVGLDGETLGPLQADPHLHLMLHKPTGVLTATTDAHQRTVLDLLPLPWRHRAPSPVGRLDKDTTGLLLLTTDGPLLHRLTHPRRHVPRTYVATVTAGLGPASVKAFSEGLTLGDGTLCRPAEIRPTAEERWDRVLVVLHEGKHHQVKRMIACCGAEVLTLHRQEMGPLALDAELDPGASRLLTDDEVRVLRALSPPSDP